jgi:hypothetical protein
MHRPAYPAWKEFFELLPNKYTIVSCMSLSDMNIWLTWASVHGLTWKLHSLNSKLYVRYFGTSHHMGYMWRGNVMQEDDAVSELTQIFVLDLAAFKQCDSTFCMHYITVKWGVSTACFLVLSWCKMVVSLVASHNPVQKYITVSKVGLLMFYQ